VVGGLIDVQDDIPNSKASPCSFPRVFIAADICDTAVNESIVRLRCARLLFFLYCLAYDGQGTMPK
jgi:hypothetical protein